MWRLTQQVIMGIGFLTFLMAQQASTYSTTLTQEPDYLVVPGNRLGKWELGKNLDAYAFGRAASQWEGKTAKGMAYYDGYNFISSFHRFGTVWSLTSANRIKQCSSS